MPSIIAKIIPSNTIKASTIIGIAEVDSFKPSLTFFSKVPIVSFSVNSLKINC